MRTASRDFTEFLAGVLTEHVGFKRGKLERCLSHLFQVSDARKILDADQEVGCDWFTWDPSTEVYTMVTSED